MVIFFVCFVPVRLLRPNMAVFVPCDCKLQRAYWTELRAFHKNHSMSRFLGFHMTAEVMLEYKASPRSEKKMTKTRRLPDHVSKARTGLKTSRNILSQSETKAKTIAIVVPRTRFPALNGSGSLLLYVDWLI